MKIIYLFPAIALLVGGCASVPPVGSVAGGECKVAHTPSYAVKGKTRYDQEWVDDTTEALVRGCKQPRPKARPASLDAVKTNPAPTVTPPVHYTPPANAAPPKKLHWWQKLRKWRKP